MDKKKLKAIIAILVLVVLACIAIYVAIKDMVSTPEDEKPPGVVKDPDIYPEGYIPTYEELEKAMEVAAEDLFGKDWEDVAVVKTDNFYSIVIPESNTSITLESVTDDRTLMATVVAAYYNNPYMITKETPAVYSMISPKVGSEVKELPTGGFIDLSTVKEEYNTMTYLVDRDNPFIVDIEGYRNDNYFEHSVNLEDLFKAYY